MTWSKQKRWGEETTRTELIAKAREAGMHARRLTQAIEALLAGNGVRATARLAGISKTRATRLFDILKDYIGVCPCGRPVTHTGHCKHRLSRDGHALRHALAGKFKAVRARGDDPLWSKVLELVPEDLPLHVKQELRQEIALKLLLHENINLAELRSSAFAEAGGQDRAGEVSLDAPLGDDLTLGKFLVAPDRLEEHPDDTFDFDTHCFSCGERGFLRRLHGHTQCTNCGCVTEPCCGD